MSDKNGPWSPHKGLVVEPNSDLEGDGYCVAAYFYREIDSTRFWYRNRQNTIDIKVWDNRYTKNDKMGETDFLFKNDAWKKSPRVVFFKPEELIVQPSWDILVLAQRLFKDYHHNVVLLAEGYPTDPKAYMCWIEGCQNQASDITLYNYWGSVYPHFVCKTCFPKVNGWCGECMPRVKKTFLLADGSELKVTPKTK